MVAALLFQDTVQAQCGEYTVTDLEKLSRANFSQVKKLAATKQFKIKSVLPDTTKPITLACQQTSAGAGDVMVVLRTQAAVIAMPGAAYERFKAGMLKTGYYLSSQDSFYISGNLKYSALVSFNESQEIYSVLVSIRKEADRISQGKAKGKCREFNLSDCEMLSSDPDTEIDNFTDNTGFESFTASNGVTGIHCKGDITNIVYIKNNGVNLLKKTALFKGNFINDIRNKGYSYMRTDEYGDNFESDDFYGFIKEEDETSGSFHIWITKKETDGDSEKVFAKKINATCYEVDSYTNTSDVAVKKGNRISLTASGSITYGFFAGSGGPGGIDGYTVYNVKQGFRHGSLLVRVGYGGDWEAVGISKVIVAKQNGVLQFLVNDNDPSNNSGVFTVDIMVTK